MNTTVQDKINFRNLSGDQIFHIQQYVGYLIVSKGKYDYYPFIGCIGICGNMISIGLNKLIPEIFMSYLDFHQVEYRTYVQSGKNMIQVKTSDKAVKLGVHNLCYSGCDINDSFLLADYKARILFAEYIIKTQER